MPIFPSPGGLKSRRERWHGALLPHEARVRIDVLDTDRRRVSAVADFTEVCDVVTVDVNENRDVLTTVLFHHEPISRSAF
jgi:NAD+ kinase